MQPIPQELIECTDIFVLNELELGQVVGATNTLSSPEEVAQAALGWTQSYA